MTLPDSNTIYIIIVVVGFLIIGVVGRRAGWFKIIGGTNALLKEQNAILTEQNVTLKTQLKTTIKVHEQDRSDWAKRHTESLNEIAKLQGKVETLTALPLNKIDETLKQFTAFGQRFVESNNKILEQLKATAVIAAEDRDVLTNQDLHIKTEVHKVMEKT